MVASKKQVANKANATKSTGPKSPAGKARVAQNALTHGVLSRHLLLADDDSTEYDALFQSLIADLRPVGALELIHVERVAVAVWRLRRLIRAETAAVAFRQAANDTRKMLNETLGLADSAKFKDSALQPLDEDEVSHMGSIAAIVEELTNLAKDRVPTNTSELLERLPIYCSHLESEASQHQQSLAAYLMQRSGLSEEHFVHMMRKVIAEDAPVFRNALKTYEQRLSITLIRQHYQEAKVIPPEAELFARYQTTLDNALTKALKALREAQDYRLRTLESPAASGDN